MFNRLTVFALVTVVVIVAASIFANLRAPQTAKEKPLFFPELSQRIEDVTMIRIKSVDDSITLTLKDQVWGVEEFGGYPALPDKVKSTVLGAADLRLNAPKTALERLYPRLGVEGPVDDESVSKILTLKDSDDENIIEVIVGKPRRSSAAQSAPGLYIRKPEEAQSYLVDGLLDISAKHTDWIERSLFDIPKEEIKRVRIEHPDGDSYTLYKTEKGQDLFQLEDMPEGKKMAPEIIINRFGAILSDVQITSVRAQAGDLTLSEADTIKATINSFDGLQVVIKTFTVDDIPYVSFEFGIDPEHVTDDEEGIAKEDLQDYVSKMNNKLADWLFEIQGFKIDILKTRSDKIVRNDSQASSAAD